MVGFADEINEVFHNLIENATKYGFENTDITVEVDLVSADRVVISVSNTGEVIAESHLSRLTERFYRVDKARSRQIGGTGLGLAIVKHIVNRHRHHGCDEFRRRCHTVRGNAAGDRRIMGSHKNVMMVWHPMPYRAGGGEGG